MWPDDTLSQQLDFGAQPFQPQTAVWCFFLFVNRLGAGPNEEGAKGLTTEVNPLVSLRSPVWILTEPLISSGKILLPI